MCSLCEIINGSIYRSCYGIFGYVELHFYFKISDLHIWNHFTQLIDSVVKLSYDISACIYLCRSMLSKTVLVSHMTYCHD